MDKEKLDKILADHKLFVNGQGGARAYLCGADLRKVNLRDVNLREADLYGADLRAADLRGVILSDVDLREADLYGADLRGANFCETNLSCSMGIIWAQVGPIGKGRRTLTGVLINDEIRLFAGCFNGTPKEFQKKCLNGGWDWEEKDKERLSKECLKAMKQVVKSIERQKNA